MNPIATQAKIRNMELMLYEGKGASVRCAPARGYAAYGNYEVNGVKVIECMECGKTEPVPLLQHAHNFRARHNATCHGRHSAGDEPPRE